MFGSPYTRSPDELVIIAQHVAVGEFTRVIASAYFHDVEAESDVIQEVSQDVYNKLSTDVYDATERLVSDGKGDVVDAFVLLRDLLSGLCSQLKLGHYRSAFYVPLTIHFVDMEMDAVAVRYVRE